MYVAALKTSHLISHSQLVAGIVAHILICKEIDHHRTPQAVVFGLSSFGFKEYLKE